VRVIIDGGAGSGKSTVARAVAKHFKLRHVSAGEKFREVARRMGFKTTGTDYLRFHEYQRKHLEIDYEIDKLILKDLRSGEWVIDSRIAGYLFKGKAYRILLKVPDVVAAKRNSLREGVSKVVALEAVKKRNSEDARRYRKLYGIDLGDTSVYNLVLDTSYFPIKDMNYIIISVLRKLLK